MASIDNKQKLKRISTSDIVPNPDNPRLVFRQQEMETLTVSIAKLGIQVPISVFQEGDHYVLIDGERRWRCANKLNLREMPALVQAKPSEYENLILMYNIHALREQWDYYTIASKLTRVIDLFESDRGYTPNEIELSAETGLSRGQIRRCRLLLDLPDSFKELLEKELELPKARQKLSEDFFIEMERSLKTVSRRLPAYQEDMNEIRQTLVDKFRSGTIEAVTDFRQLGKIATAIQNFGLAQAKAERALGKVFDPKSKVGIRQAFEETVQFEYDEKRAEKHVSALDSYLTEVIDEDLGNQLEDELVKGLKALRRKINKLFRN